MPQETRPIEGIKQQATLAKKNQESLKYDHSAMATFNKAVQEVFNFAKTQGTESQPPIVTGGRVVFYNRYAKFRLVARQIGEALHFNEHPIGQGETAGFVIDASEHGETTDKLWAMFYDLSVLVSP